MLRTLELDRSAPTSPNALAYGIGITPVGPALIAWNDQGIWYLAILGGNLALSLREFRHEWPNVAFTQDDSAADTWLSKVFAAGPVDGVTVVLQGTEFQRRVWRELLKIPRATQMAYGDIARRLGCPGGARAVGSAVGANRVAYLVPCHRVVRSNGQASGFRWGLDAKLRLCDWEVRHR